MVDQEIRVLGDENIIANPKNSQKQYPLTFKAVPNVIVYGRKKADLNFTVPITEGTNFNFNLERTAIIFSDSFNLEEYSYIMVKNPFEEISDFFYVSSLEELDPTGKEFNEFNDEVVKWLRRLVNIISNRCMIFETTLFKDLNNFPNIKSGQTFIRTEDGWTGITIRDINSELDLIFNKYVEEINKKIQEHQTQMNELLEQWKQDIQKYAENVKQYEIVRVVTQTGHGFVFEPVMYSISQRKFVKAVFPHGADGVAVRVDDNNFRLVWAGRVEIPVTAKDTQQRDFVLGEYYFLGEGSNGGIQREKPDTYYQHLFQVMYSDELRQNIADILLSVPINQKGKRWDVGEAKTTVNDIEELKMSDFPVGKVVEALGYYKAGDGADHKRIISTSDDGSGVQLNNGLWANIVHNGEVNVSWFGAKGDGISSDVLAIKKANDYLDNLKGGILNFEDGTYLIDTFEIDISNRGGVGFGAFECKSNVSYIGNKNTILKVKDNVNNENFVFQAIFVEKKNSLSNINFKNIIFDLNGHKNHMQSKFYSEHYACGAIYTFYPENITIDNCIFKNCPGLNYIALGYVNKAIITNNKFLESADVIDGNIVRDHSSILLFGTNATVTDNYLKNSKRSKVATAIEVNSSESIISNNYANGYKVGMITANVGDIPVKDVLISENIFENNSKTFELWSAKDNVIENIKFFNNIATQNGKTSSGFMLDFLTNNKGTIRNLFISNNNFIQDNDGQGEYSLFSIYLGEDIENVFINNNSFYNNSGSAIAMYKGCNNIKITNNIFDNCLNTNSPYISGAIIIQADSGYIDNVLIKDNTIKLATENSIYVGIFLDHDCRNIKIINNIIYGEQFIFANTLNTKGIDNNIIYLEHFLFETTSKNISYPCSIGSKIYTKEGYNFVKKVNDLEKAYWNKEFYKNIGIQYVQSIAGDIAFNERPTKETPWAWVYTTSTWEPVYFASAPLQQLSTNYMTDKMKQDGVYNDYIYYMDEKTAYDKKQEKLEQERQLAYQEALKENPDLTYEQFMSLQPMTLNLVEEPQPSENLKKFMEKYL